MVASCQSPEDSKSVAKPTPSERSVTRFLTATSRPLTLAFNLGSKTAISSHSLCATLGTNKPFSEGFLLNSYPLLLPSHVHEFIGCVASTAKYCYLIVVEAVAIIDALLCLWSKGERT